ncbi:MAG: AAA family ATPase [Mycolicibacterium sp.]|uniref:AAA family ATPase n=1 Tax=Mycolicibacterium sp. TaxID=2320850 RepID=UPI000F954745|nr:AAA family ATPase [Mycolicibacterium sp.]RUP32970.1 MAG: AAA family ATPase [Mycolicibacterium sp.]
MLSTDQIDYLIEATRSSVKRFGGPGPTLSHLAFVLSDKWASNFAEVFGSDGQDDVKLLLRAKTFVGDETAIRTLLTSGDSKNAMLGALHAQLTGKIDEERAKLASPLSQDASTVGSQESADTPAEETAAEWPERTRRYLTTVEPRDDLLERDEAIIQVASVLTRTRRRIPVVLGPRGSGRSTLIGGVVRQLNAVNEAKSVPVYRVSPDTLGVSPEGPLGRIIDDCESPAVLVIDDFDRMVGLGGDRANTAVLRLVASAAAHPHLLLVLVCDTRHFRRLAMHDQDLNDQLATVRIGALSEAAAAEAVRRALPTLEGTHGVAVSAALRSMALLPARPTDVAVHPGLAMDRLDAAASRARVLGDPEADVTHLAGLSSSDTSRTGRIKDLENQLGQRVVGQQNAVRAVAARLALTMARLDLRPERPDGVFLFVGPTGVGKTELARAVSATVFGSEDRMIRLDMSEYSHDWAVSRIVGPMPGYVGSTEPETWLTTKVAQMPDCVILLDEIEKAHPVVWNTFLQVFDAGRLTDSRGVTADFSSTVIVMTSNLGAAAASAPALGFGGAAGNVDRTREKITRTVKETMAPELINRIDEMVVFDALTVEAIETIAIAELARVTERLAESGWLVRHDPAVVTHLVTTGYDPAYGARHLQRNIERLFLGLVAESESREVEVAVRDGALAVAAAGA